MLRLTNDLGRTAKRLERYMFDLRKVDPSADLTVMVDLRKAALLLFDNERLWTEVGDEEASPKEIAYAFLESNPRADAAAIAREGISSLSAAHNWVYSWRREHGWKFGWKAS